MTRKPCATTAKITPSAPNKKRSAITERGLCAAEIEAKRKFAEWLEKYRPVEEAIYAERDRRERRKRINRGKAFGDLCEITEGRASFCRRTGFSAEEANWILGRRRAIHPSLELPMLIGEMAWLAAITLRKELTKRITRVKHDMMRPAYYERERNRRLALAAERRKIKTRHTTNPCPTKEQILDAWIKVKDSNESMLRFGSLLEDLECYVDNSLLHDGGIIVGRRPGIKGWLQMNIPALYLKYSTVMAYKAAAKKMRQTIGLSDPMPLSSIMQDASIGDGTGKSSGTESTQKEGLGEDCNLQDYDADEIIRCTKPCDGNARNGKQGTQVANSPSKVADLQDCSIRPNSKGNGNPDARQRSATSHHTATLSEPPKEINASVSPEKEAETVRHNELHTLKATALYSEVMNLITPGKRKRTELIRKLHDLTDPNSIEDANMLQEWRRFYESKITVRTKSVWGRRLLGRFRNTPGDWGTDGRRRKLIRGKPE